MGAGAAVVVRWAPEQQICRELIEAVKEVMDPDKLSTGSGSGWIGGAEEPAEIHHRRAMYERPSCTESVFGKMLANKTMSLCAPYLQYIKVLGSTTVVTKCTSTL